MTWSLNTELRVLLAVVASGGMLPLTACPALAQETIEQQYKNAVALFQRPDLEGACDAFQEIDRRSPGYRDVRKYVNIACKWKRDRYQNEKEYFEEGEKDLNLKRYEDAKQQLEQALKVSKVLEHPKYRTQIENYLKGIDAEADDERSYQKAVALFDQKKYDEATLRFSQVAKRGGPEAANAQSYLDKIESARRETEIDTTFDEGVQLFEAHKYTKASVNFKTVVEAGGPRAKEAQDYLRQIEQIIAPPGVVKPPVSKPSVSKPPASGPSISHPPRPIQEQAKPPAGDSSLRMGLVAFYTGHLDEAETYLTDYLGHDGQKKAVAYFFRGAAHISRYFVSGEEDAHQKKLALADFHSVHAVSVHFRPPKGYVSPKILAVYLSAGR